MKPVSSLLRRFFLSVGVTVLLGIRVHAADITVFAAASLSDVLKEIAWDYQAATGHKLVFNLAASSTLEDAKAAPFQSAGRASDKSAGSSDCPSASAASSP